MQDGLVVVTYVIYLLLGVALTLWVGRTLSRNGRVFLEDVFGGDRRMAEAVNHLLVGPAGCGSGRPSGSWWPAST